MSGYDTRREAKSPEALRHLTPAHQQREFVDEVLADWHQPEVFEVGAKWGLDVFGPKGAPYEAIVLKPAVGQKPPQNAQKRPRDRRTAQT